MIFFLLFAVLNRVLLGGLSQANSVYHHLNHSKIVLLFSRREGCAWDSLLTFILNVSIWKDAGGCHFVDTCVRGSVLPQMFIWL